MTIEQVDDRYVEIDWKNDPAVVTIPSWAARVNVLPSLSHERRAGERAGVLAIAVAGLVSRAMAWGVLPVVQQPVPISWQDIV